jgi:hypothetical protein
MQPGSLRVGSTSAESNSRTLSILSDLALILATTLKGPSAIESPFNFAPG